MAPAVVLAALLSATSVCAQAQPVAEEKAAPLVSPRLVQAADLALQGRRLIEAQALLDRLPSDLETAPGRQAMLLRAELLLLRGGRAADALTILDRLPDTPEADCRKAGARSTALIQVEQARRAAALLEPLEAACGDAALYWRVRGRAELAMGRQGEGAAAMRRALALDPENADIANDLAVALLSGGDAANAAAILVPLVRANPGRADMRLNLDFADGMAGSIPSRRQDDDDAYWSQRLQYAATGAREGGRNALAEALFAQALVARPRHDPGLWRQYAEIADLND